MNIENILKNNKDWVNQKISQESDYFTELAKGQEPKVLYIGCSDSRVTAEEMMGAGPGDIFVHRNIANMVVSTDLNSMSVVNYAVEHLKVEHIIICGHYGCGGVKAAMQDQDLGVLNPWLQNIRDVYRLHQEELEYIGDEEKKYKRLVDLNVQEQCINMLKTISVQEAYRQSKITIHGWVFDIASGNLIDLDIDFPGIMKKLMPIYEVK